MIRSIVMALAAVLCSCTIDVELEEGISDARNFFFDSGTGDSQVIGDANAGDANPEDAAIVPDAALPVTDAALDIDAGT